MFVGRLISVRMNEHDVFLSLSFDLEVWGSRVYARKMFIIVLSFCPRIFSGTMYDTSRSHEAVHHDFAIGNVA